MTPEVFSSMFEAGCMGWWTTQDRNTTVFMTSEGGRAFISHYGGIVTDFFEVSSRRNAMFMPNMESVRQQWATVPPLRPDIGSFMRAYEAWWKGEFEGKTFSEAMNELKSSQPIHFQPEPRSGVDFEFPNMIGHTVSP